MTIDQYNKWIIEIKDQKDILISTQQYMRLCQIFIQDVWLDTRPGFEKTKELNHKSDLMFELQGHFVK